MATLQVRVDDLLKAKADSLFSSLGLDTSTAIRIFLSSSVENNGIPFRVGHSNDYSLEQAVYDSRNHEGESATGTHADLFGKQLVAVATLKCCPKTRMPSNSAK